MPARERTGPIVDPVGDIRQQVQDIHRAIVGTVDGSHPGIHRRLDGFESIAKDHEERITEIEDVNKEFNRLRENRNAEMADHDTRIKANAAAIQALESAKGQGLNRWWALAMVAAGGLISQGLAALGALIQAGAHATPPHH